MQPVGAIAPRAWMRAHDVIAVFAALGDGGAVSRIVGGAVRDAVLGRPAGDLDIATELRPEAAMSALRRAGLKVLPTGLAHGTISAFTDLRRIEITTLRRDVESHGRHATVAFGGDWIGDARRRDLTMNALYLDPDGRLYDPLGGLADLRAGRVRFVGDPAGRIIEDHLRILRFFRFHAAFGHGQPDRHGLLACRDHRHRLQTLSGERVRDELMKLLAAPGAAAVLRVMATHGILAEIGDGEWRLAAFEALIARWPAADPIARLASLVGGQADRLGSRLRLANRDRARLALLADPPPLPAAGDARGLRRLSYELGRAPAGDLAAFAGRTDWRELLANWRPPELPVRGADARALGIASGPRVGALLRQIESWWIDGDFSADRAACLEALRAFAGLGR